MIHFSLQLMSLGQTIKWKKKDIIKIDIDEEQILHFSAVHYKSTW